MPQIRLITDLGNITEETARADAAIIEAEQEYANDGALLDAREALSSLRRKHFG